MANPAFRLARSADSADASGMPLPVVCVRILSQRSSSDAHRAQKRSPVLVDTTSTHHTGPLPAERGKYGGLDCRTAVISRGSRHRDVPVASRHHRFGATCGIASRPVERVAVDGNGKDFVNRGLSVFQFANRIGQQVKSLQVAEVCDRLRERGTSI